VLAPVRVVRDAVDVTTGETVRHQFLRGFKPVTVFDERALVSPPAIPEVRPELLTGDPPARLTDALRHRITWAGFLVEDGDVAPANGRTDFRARTVTIRPDLEPAARAKTLAHETAHVLLHDPDTLPVPIGRDRKEVEAESVAYLVCAHVGLDAARYSVPYLANWSGGNLQLVHDTAGRVITTARELTDTIDRCPAPTPAGDAAPGANAAAHPRVAHHLGGQLEADAAAALRSLAAHPSAWRADPRDLQTVARLAARVPPTFASRVSGSEGRDPRPATEPEPQPQPSTNASSPPNRGAVRSKRGATNPEASTVTDPHRPA
jgi:hypothetical protein